MSATWDLMLIVMTGIAATTAMTSFLYIIHWTGFANGDMVRAIGSAITGREEKSLLPGMAFHFIAGILFAALYIYTLSFIPDMARGSPGRVARLTELGALLGFVQGLIVSFGLVIAVAEHHPIDRFREAGFRVALVHIVAHVIFGAVVGMMAAMI
ncbi:hypothetical protein EBZ80_17155 [bacterium]|nr:hypothetical protein [bacterium]